MIADIGVAVLALGLLAIVVAVMRVPRGTAGLTAAVSTPGNPTDPEDVQRRISQRVVQTLYQEFVRLDGPNQGADILAFVRQAPFDYSEWMSEGVAEYGTLTKMVEAAGFDATPDEITRANTFLSAMSAAGVFNLGRYDQAVIRRMMREEGQYVS